MKDLNHFYSARKNEFSQSCERLKSQIRIIAMARTGVALLILAFAYFGFSDTIYWYLIIPFVVIFLFLVSRHGKIQSQFDLVNKLQILNGLEVRVLQNDYSSFDDGLRFSDPHHAYSYDLDLFGSGSLFQFLNRCGTAIGESKLAADLSTAQSSAESIHLRQDSIKELANDVELRQWFWAQGNLLKETLKKDDNFFSWLNESDVVLGRTLYKVLLVLFPSISLVLIGFTIYDWTYFPLVLIFGGVQWAVISMKSKEINVADRSLSHSNVLFDKYAKLLNKIAKANFKCEHLLKIHDEAQDAALRIKKFSQLVNAFESRKNGIASMFGNSLYLYDLQCLYHLEKWRSVNKLMVKDWLDKIAEMDALISLATFYFNSPGNTFPEISDSLYIQADSISHPLIDSKERVANSFSIGAPENIMLITGANMAGKSTFLRTAGVNMVLALAGSSVCAQKFACPKVHLFTSMRATDSLVDHQSYFYAELSRLKLIMDQVRTNKPILVLLDEILRGTNSNDKHEGSVGLIKQFVSNPALVMLASHDIELGALENKFPKAIRNYCFESEIVNDALAFDYTIKDGIANKANATFLMQQMGILPPKQ